jgi:hypothetical protein
MIIAPANESAGVADQHQHLPETKLYVKLDAFTVLDERTSQ